MGAPKGGEESDPTFDGGPKTRSRGARPRYEDSSGEFIAPLETTDQSDFEIGFESELDSRPEESAETRDERGEAVLQEGERSSGSRDSPTPGVQERENDEITPQPAGRELDVIR